MPFHSFLGRLPSCIPSLDSGHQSGLRRVKPRQLQRPTLFTTSREQPFTLPVVRWLMGKSPLSSQHTERLTSRPIREPVHTSILLNPVSRHNMFIQPRWRRFLWLLLPVQAAGLNHSILRLLQPRQQPRQLAQLSHPLLIVRAINKRQQQLGQLGHSPHQSRRLMQLLVSLPHPWRDSQGLDRVKLLLTLISRILMLTIHTT
jgi:hypothetical protein